MPKSDNTIHDAVIIGAGISGLVCGCYLAKAGLKVLIAEQHNKPGGYCTSFQRQGYAFDAAAHSFGGYRNGGIVRKVFDDLNINKNIRIIRFDPSDIIVAPDYKVSFHTDLQKTVSRIQNSFPKESGNVEAFFTFLLNPPPGAFARMRSSTFKDLLDTYFNDNKLKTLLAFPVFGNGALPPSRMSAFIGAKIFTEFLIDGGYYPEDGMQKFSDALADRFQEYGGELHLSTPARKIRVKNGHVEGVVIDKGNFIPSWHVISCCDAMQTFLTLLGKKIIGQEFVTKIKHMIPSLSMFVLYLGMDDKFATTHSLGSNTWCLSHYDTNKMYDAALHRNVKNMTEYMFRISSDKRSILAFTNTSFRNKRYWTENKQRWIESFIAQLSPVHPKLSQHISYKDAGTPSTLYRYTLNYHGSAYGWSCTPEQLGDPDFRKPPFAEGLYLTGHWSTQGLGIPGVTYLGYDTAHVVMKKIRYKKLL